MKTDSFFDRFFNDPDFRKLMEVTYKVPDNSDTEKDSDSDSEK